MWISKIPFIFLIAYLPTTHKPKIVMNHEEMHPALRKNDFAKNAQFQLLILPFFYPKNTNFKNSFYLPLPPPTNNSQTKNRDD